jgi:hypothetical protein
VRFASLISPACRGLSTLLVGSALAACAPEPDRGAAGPTTMIKDDGSAQSSGGESSEAGAAGVPNDIGEGGGAEQGCIVRQAPRTFVGFADKQGLDAFERTAMEAEQLLAALKRELCELSPAQDSDGTLRAALSGGLLEITAVRFTRKDLTTANVDVQTIAPDGDSQGQGEIHWLLRTKRGARGWQIAASARR